MTYMLGKADEDKTRFYYAMMYYSFEIKNNMHASITYYQRLKAVGTFVQMPWVSETFTIDEGKISEYGGVKINKAQIVKTFDEELMQLKLNEVKELEEAKKPGMQRPSRVKPCFAKFAGFYLDQLCHYLHKSPANYSEAAGLSNNEEKIKEMWGKLMYSVCRC